MRRAGDNVMTAARAAIEAASHGGVPVMFHVSAGRPAQSCPPMRARRPRHPHVHGRGRRNRASCSTADGRVLPEIGTRVTGASSSTSATAAAASPGRSSAARWTRASAAHHDQHRPASALHHRARVRHGDDDGQDAPRGLERGARDRGDRRRCPRRRSVARTSWARSARPSRERRRLPPRGPRDPAHRRVRHHGAGPAPGSTTVLTVQPRQDRAPRRRLGPPARLHGRRLRSGLRRRRS